jgi:polyhydroxyalkanoate synthesis regulator protein
MGWRPTSNKKAHEAGCCGKAPEPSRKASKEPQSHLNLSCKDCALLEHTRAAKFKVAAVLPSYSSKSCAAFIQQQKLCCLHTAAKAVLPSYSSKSCAAFIQQQKLCCLHTAAQAVLPSYSSKSCAAFIQQQKLCCLHTAAKAVLPSYSSKSCAAVIQQQKPQSYSL